MQSSTWQWPLLAAPAFIGVGAGLNSEHAKHKNSSLSSLPSPFINANKRRKDQKKVIEIKYPKKIFPSKIKKKKNWKGKTEKLISQLGPAWVQLEQIEKLPKYSWKRANIYFGRKKKPVIEVIFPLLLLKTPQQEPGHDDGILF